MLIDSGETGCMSLWNFWILLSKNHNHALLIILLYIYTNTFISIYRQLVKFVRNKDDKSDWWEGKEWKFGLWWYRQNHLSLLWGFWNLSLFSAWNIVCNILIGVARRYRCGIIRKKGLQSTRERMDNEKRGRGWGWR